MVEEAANLMPLKNQRKTEEETSNDMMPAISPSLPESQPPPNNPFNPKPTNGALRDGSATTNACSSYIGPRFHPQYPQNVSQPSKTPIPTDPTGLPCTWYT